MVDMVAFTFGTGETRMIPREAQATYARKEKAVARMMELGGIKAPFTPETNKLVNTIRLASRKIQRNGWFSV